MADLSRLIDPPLPPADDERESLRSRDSLTSRERQVLELVWEGRSNKSIAYILSLSPSTINTYLARLRNTYGVRTRMQLVRQGLRDGYLRT